METNISASMPTVALEIERPWSATYRWIPIVGGLVSFALAFMSGANDIPISFGASVGSGVLTLRQSVLLAFVMEVLGATFLGNHSIDVIDSFVRQSITFASLLAPNNCSLGVLLSSSNLQILKEMPSNDLLMWGCFIAMIAAASWLALATYLEMPVTSFLSIEGAIIGVCLTVEGWNSIYWSKMLLQIILVCLVRKRSELLDDSRATQPDRAIPGQEDNIVEEQKEVSPEDLLKQFNELRVLHTVYEVDEEAVDDSPRSTIRCSPVCGPAIQLKHMLSGTPNQLTFQKLMKPKRITIKQRIVDCVHKIRRYTFDHKIVYGQETAALHAVAKKFHKRMEEPFGFLLILTASISALGHGSNTVPSVMALYAGILNIFRSHSTQKTEDQLAWHLDTWVRFLGGFAASAGYGIWGWKLVRCLGGRLMFLSPSRAFSAQFCTLATVILATRVKFPFSTAHVFIGALVGVSLADNIKSLNWRLLGAFMLMWALTLLFTCGTASAFYAFTVFSPSVSVRD
uniref:Phosphate transporter n=1 Tax=Pteris cretica TaxID=49539 RepID=A0AA95Z1Q1_9MONI|nr:phosphate transporter B 4;1 [Pteris cretica]